MASGSNPEAQLLLKRFPAVPGLNLLVMLCPDPAAAGEFARRADEACFFNSDYAVHLSISRALSGRAKAFFGACRVPAGGTHGEAAVFLPRGRQLTEMILAQTARALVPSSPVWLVGQVKAGARAAREAIEKGIGPVTRTEAARHCLLYVVNDSASAPGTADLDRWVRQDQVETSGRTLTLVSLPGIFSYGRLDPGTQLLLETLKGVKAKRILDFGCGSGAIGTALRLSLPAARVDLVDSSAYAIESARRTLAENGLTAKGVWATDVFSDVPDRYDLIVSNPPFHARTDTTWRVAETFVAGAPDRLVPGGRLRIVSNRAGKFQSLLKRAFGSSEVLARRGSYSVIETRRPRS